MSSYEKLGAFYLGREIDATTGETTSTPLLYDSRDLTTHAVAVGMTGSGKTGLCLDLLEEAGMDRIPAIVIDPKGDIANLLLTFPQLSAEEFRPWIDESQAVREGQTADEFAASEAEKWRAGLAGWEQSGERIQRFRDNVDLQVFTPGSSTGRSVAILKSFAAPDAAVIQDVDAFQERVQSAVSGLLALVGINVDPIRSREHILLSNILSKAWSESKDLTLGQLITEIQNPPLKKIGVMDLDTFFPPAARLELAMTMNNLLASPSFASWLTGEPLDIERLLHSEDGKPQISIMSIAHLSDAERMFFVTILLNEVLSWMRSQAGTSSLRAILYMDEVFGFFPPVANPPAKKPMLTLLKQARAFGLGVVLATQNPVDLDYKGLSNTGTWFLGRLQTERDKARVLEGLEGAAANTGASFDRSEMERVLAGLGSRKFLMNNVHEDGPVVFETRWAMSYLRGPLTLKQIRQLSGDSPTIKESDPQTALADAVAQTEQVTDAEPIEQAHGGNRDRIPGDIYQSFAQTRGDVGERDLVYRPAVLATGRLHYIRKSCDVDQITERTFMVPLTGRELPDDIWSRSAPVEGQLEVDKNSVEGIAFEEFSIALEDGKTWSAWEKEFVDYLYHQQRLTIYECKELKLSSQPQETLGAFKVRLQQLAAEKRDLEMERLRKKYSEKLGSLQSRIRRAEQKVEKEESQYKHRRLDSILSVGSNILGAVLGRKTISAANSRRASSSMRSFGRTSKERDDVVRAKESLGDVKADYEAMEEEFQLEIKDLQGRMIIDEWELEEWVVPARKGELEVEQLSLVWLPYCRDATGRVTTAF
ncbi:MAG: DUF853 family protein [Pirellulaceae bacterium]|nr:DUF853 family protein [Pirellulaceae bacterium]